MLWGFIMSNVSGENKLDSNILLHEMDDLENFINEPEIQLYLAPV